MFRSESIPNIHALIWPQPLVHPQLRLFYNGAQLVQIRLYLFIVFHILACDQQLHLEMQCWRDLGEQKRTVYQKRLPLLKSSELSFTFQTKVFKHALDIDTDCSCLDG